VRAAVAIVIALVVMLAACAEFEAKRERVGSVHSKPPEGEPDLEDAAQRVIAGDDVVVSRNGDWLVALRCLWVLRDVDRCEVAFVERGRVVGTVDVFDRRATGDRRAQARAARRAVERGLAEHLGRQRVALNADYIYGPRDPRATSVFGVVEDDELVVRAMIFPQRWERGRTAWPYGAATTRAVTYQSPRAKDLVVLPVELSPDRATAFALFRAGAGHDERTYQLVMFVPPIDRPRDQPRFPTADEVRALHAAVGREIAERIQRQPTFGAQMVDKKYGLFRLEEFLDTPTHRLDFTETLLHLRAELRDSRD
jgi:hypothetical protein